MVYDIILCMVHECMVHVYGMVDDVCVCVCVYGHDTCIHDTWCTCV